MWWRRLRYVLLLAALCAIATCPSAKRSCTANARAREAEDLLAYLAERASLVYVATGKFPQVAASPTPSRSCCDQGGSCGVDPTIWTASPWRELSFSIDDPHRYTYQYTPDPAGTSATLRAIGDLDCDGKPAVYEVKLTGVGGYVGRAWTRTAPYE
jgi:hypothetical protein